MKLPFMGPYVGRLPLQSKLMSFFRGTLFTELQPTLTCVHSLTLRVPLLDCHVGTRLSLRTQEVPAPSPFQYSRPH